MLRKHLFLVVAVAILGLMVVAGAVKLITGKAGGEAVAAGAPAGKGPGGPGGGGARRGPRATAVTTLTVENRPFSAPIEVLGVAKAKQSVVLTAPATQLVEKINFVSGQSVREGQVLAQLNAREQNAAIIESQSAANLAKANWQRYQTLADKGIASPAQAEQYKAQYDQALATVAADQARLADRFIRAPFSGTVGLSDAAPGMLVNPGAVIATLDDLSVIKVDFPVPERFIGALRPGLTITATVDAYPNVLFTGRLAQLDNRLDPDTRAITARAEFANPDHRLRSGMLLHVTVDQAVQQRPSAPDAAVAVEGEQAYVYTIGKDPQKGQVAIRRPVNIGMRSEGFVEIVQGLRAGEVIIADGLNRVRNNDAIQVEGGPGAQARRGPGGGQGGQRPPAA